MTQKEMITKIIEILSTQDMWIVNQFYRFTVNMTKNEKGGAAV